MLRSFVLSSKHYASKWEVRTVSNRHDRDRVNALAYDFATTSDPVKREALQLELLECFHGYLIKYFNMIVFGQLPALTSPQGKDAKIFLRMLLRKGSEASFQNLRESCKSLHLAFKEYTTSDEVYDVIVLVFLSVCAHYDPHLDKKTEAVYKAIAGRKDKSIVRVEEIANVVGFDPGGCIRILVRRGFLQSVAGPRKTIQGYTPGPNWPPPANFFENGPIGFVFFAQRFFRWYLRNHIMAKMAEIESTEHVLQLDHIPISSDEDNDGGISAIPNCNGNWTDHRGVRWSCDTSLLDHWKTMDITALDDDWVKKTDDFLFRTLTIEERYLLQLVFAKELTWSEIAEIFDCCEDSVSDQYKEIMTFLEDRAKAVPSLPVAA